jgi:hypothetical protein
MIKKSLGNPRHGKSLVWNCSPESSLRGREIGGSGFEKKENIALELHDSQNKKSTYGNNNIPVGRR